MKYRLMNAIIFSPVILLSIPSYANLSQVPSTGLSFPNQIFTPQGQNFQSTTVFPPQPVPGGGAVGNPMQFMGGIPAFNPFYSARVAAEQAQRQALYILNSSAVAGRAQAFATNVACAQSVPMGTLPPAMSAMRMSEISTAIRMGTVAMVCRQPMNFPMGGGASPFGSQNPFGGGPGFPMSSPMQASSFMDPQMALQSQANTIQSQFMALEQQKFALEQRRYEDSIKQADRQYEQAKTQVFTNLMGQSTQLMANMALVNAGGSPSFNAPFGQSSKGEYIGGRGGDQHEESGDHSGHRH